MFKSNYDLFKSNFDLIKPNFDLIKPNFDLNKSNFGFVERYGFCQKNIWVLETRYMGVGKFTDGGLEKKYMGVGISTNIYRLSVYMLTGYLLLQFVANSLQHCNI